MISSKTFELIDDFSYKTIKAITLGLLGWLPIRSTKKKSEVVNTFTYTILEKLTEVKLALFYIYRGS
jgi:hypothetical protein